MALADVASPLVRALRAINFTPSHVSSLLAQGGAADALFRGEPAAVRWALRDSTDEVSTAVRFFLLRDPLPRSALSFLPDDVLAGLATVGALRVNESDSPHDAEMRMLISVRPATVAGEDHFVFSDPDASLATMTMRRNHVIGLGAASRSLLRLVPSSPVGSVLDLGTGSGVQLLSQGAASRLVGTDISARALDFARATLESSGLRPDLRVGSWFEPVADEHFERIIANPPFVVGPPRVGHVYRDSGLYMDEASRVVISQAANHLAPGGTAYMLASWIHTPAMSWQERVAEWIPDRGVSAWVVQRDVADPALYVGTWLKDEGEDMRSPRAQQRSQEWLQHFAEAEVTGIGFGYVILRHIGDAPSEVIAEEMPQQFTDPLASEITEHFARREWLRAKHDDEIAASRFALRPGLALEEVRVAASEMGFSPTVTRLTRTDGPRWSHDIDEALAAILGGLHPEGLALSDIVKLWCTARDASSSEVLPEVVSAVRDLVAHGMILPATLLDSATPEQIDTDE